jgi:hypothetical protein
MKERSNEIMILDILLIIRNIFYSSILVVLHLLLNSKIKKHLYMFWLLIKLSFILLEVSASQTLR